MFVAKSQNFKTLIDPDLKARLDKVLDVKNLSLTDFVENVVRWFLSQDDLVQSLVAGQLAPTTAILELVRFWAKSGNDNEDYIEFKLSNGMMIGEEKSKPKPKRAKR